MASIDDVTRKVEELATDITRVIDVLDGVPLPPEAQAKVDALAARLDELNTVLDTAVPPVTGTGEEPEPVA